MFSLKNMIFHLLGKKNHVMETELGEICQEGKKNAMLIFFYFLRGFLYDLILFYVILLFFLYSNMQKSDHIFAYKFHHNLIPHCQTIWFSPHFTKLPKK